MDAMISAWMSDLSITRPDTCRRQYAFALPLHTEQCNRWKFEALYQSPNFYKIIEFLQ